MARGKQAAAAAVRRAEAAHEHIDRLTDQLVDAKKRARDHEAAARQLPQALSEIDRLRAQIDSETFDRVSALEARVDEVTAERDNAFAWLMDVRDKWARISLQFMQMLHETGRTQDSDAVNELLHALGEERVCLEGIHAPEKLGHVAVARIARARRLASKAAAERLTQAEVMAREATFGAITGRDSVIDEVAT